MADLLQGLGDEGTDLLVGGGDGGGGRDLLQRDDAHAWQRDGEGLDVTLQVVDRQALALQGGQLGVEELAEAQDPHLGAGLQEPLDVGDVVAVVAASRTWAS